MVFSLNWSQVKPIKPSPTKEATSGNSAHSTKWKPIPMNHLGFVRTTLPIPILLRPLVGGTRRVFPPWRLCFWGLPSLGASPSPLPGSPSLDLLHCLPPAWRLLAGLAMLIWFLIWFLILIWFSLDFDLILIWFWFAWILIRFGWILIWFLFDLIWLILIWFRLDFDLVWLGFGLILCGFGLISVWL